MEDELPAVSTKFFCLNEVTHNTSLDVKDHYDNGSMVRKQRHTTTNGEKVKETTNGDVEEESSLDDINEIDELSVSFMEHIMACPGDTWRI